MNRIATFVGIALAGVILVGGAHAAAQDMNTDYDHQYKFSMLKGYSWGKVQASDPLLEPRLAAAVDHILQGYGFKESAKTGDGAVADPKPTTMIVTVIEARNSQQYVAFYRGMGNLDWHRSWGEKGFSDSATSLRQIHGGTLVVDIYDGPSGKLIWRGTAAGGEASREKASQSDVDKEVATLFAQFPPKSGGKLLPNQQEVPPSASSPSPNAPN
jgi:hypothetical protein